MSQTTLSVILPNLSCPERHQKHMRNVPLPPWYHLRRRHPSNILLLLLLADVALVRGVECRSAGQLTGDSLGLGLELGLCPPCLVLDDGGEVKPVDKSSH